MQQDLPDATNSKGMILDDVFYQIREMRRIFKLPEPRFGLNDIEKYPGTSQSIAAFVRATIDKHESGIYIGRGILAQRLFDSLRIHPRWLGKPRRQNPSANRR